MLEFALLLHFYPESFQSLVDSLTSRHRLKHLLDKTDPSHAPLKINMYFDQCPAFVAILFSFNGETTIFCVVVRGWGRVTVVSFRWLGKVHRMKERNVGYDLN